MATPLPTSQDRVQGSAFPTEPPGGKEDAAGRPLPVKAVSRHRLALVLVIAVYPLITAILYALAPLTDGWSVWQRTLVIAPAMVGIMVYALIPFVHRTFRSFLLV
jgi:antibiotic biosynthesis monooxygenase (ABM) superfamily enzyme